MRRKDYSTCRENASGRRTRHGRFAQIRPSGLAPTSKWPVDNDLLVFAGMTQEHFIGQSKTNQINNERGRPCGRTLRTSDHLARSRIGMGLMTIACVPKCANTWIRWSCKNYQARMLTLQGRRHCLANQWDVFQDTACNRNIGDLKLRPSFGEFLGFCFHAPNVFNH
jgi:hypothetical protein